MSKLAIKNINDAELVWKEFHSFYGFETAIQLAAKIPSSNGTLQVSMQDTDTDTIEKIKKIQRLWKNFTRQNSLLRIIPQQENSTTKYSIAELLTFNNNTLRRSINIEKSKEFLKFLKDLKPDAAILKDPLLPYVLTNLKVNKKITQRQYHTWSKYLNFVKNFPCEGIYPILNEQGEFSEAAQQWLLPIFEDKSNPKYLDQEQLNTFKLLIKSLPKEEHFFYLSPADIFEKQDKEGNYLYPLGRRLHKFKVFFEHNKKFSHLSASVNDAFCMARYGSDEYFPQYHLMGKISPTQIEYGIKQHRRFSFMHHADINNPEKIHDAKNPTEFEIEEHDRYHSLVLSSIPNDILQIVEKLIETIRKITGFNMSREIWDFIDAEFNSFQLQYTNHTLRKIDIKERTELFFSMIHKNVQHNVFFNKLIRMMLIISIKNDPKEWQDLIDEKVIDENLNNELKIISQLYDYIKNDDMTMKLLKTNYLAPYLSYDKKTLNKINELFEKHKHEIIPITKFNKNKNKSSIVTINTIYLSIDEIKKPIKFVRLLKQYDSLHSTELNLSLKDFLKNPNIFDTFSKNTTENKTNLIRPF